MEEVALQGVRAASRESEFELRSEAVGKREIKRKSICREGFPHGLDVS